jgi:hypothetical protein
MTCRDKCVDWVQGQETPVRDALSKGCIVQGTHCPRDGTSETFRLGVHVTVFIVKRETVNVPKTIRVTFLNKVIIAMLISSIKNHVLLLQKSKKIFLIKKGSGAKSYMTNVFLIQYIA